MKKGFKMIFPVAALALLAGCSVPSYNVTVYMSPKFLDVMKVYPSLEVDVVGVNPNEVERLKSTPVEEYFNYDSALRHNSDRCTLTFSEDSVKPKLLRKNHPVWKKFAAKEADQLFLIANIPGDGGKEPAKDQRKVMIPLESSLFGSDDRYFEVSPSGILRLKKQPAGTAEAEDVAAKAKAN